MTGWYAYLRKLWLVRWRPLLWVLRYWFRPIFISYSRTSIAGRVILGIPSDISSLNANGQAQLWENFPDRNKPPFGTATPDVDNFITKSWRVGGGGRPFDNFAKNGGMRAISNIPRNDLEVIDRYSLISFSTGMVWTSLINPTVYQQKLNKKLVNWCDELTYREKSSQTIFKEGVWKIKRKLEEVHLPTNNLWEELLSENDKQNEVDNSN